MGKPHKHQKEIIAWANGDEIEYLNTVLHKWVALDGEEPSWDEECEYRVKPEQVYPESSLTEHDCWSIFQNKMNETSSGVISAKYLADLAVKRHCQDQEKANEN